MHNPSGESGSAIGAPGIRLATEGRVRAVRILVARCEIAYHGRATTRLGAGDRVILFKDDGSLCVHADRGYKPLNYMAGPTTVKEEGDVIRVYRAASDETLVIVVHEVHEDARHELDDDAVLEREAPSSRSTGCSSGRPRRSSPAWSSSSASGPPTPGRSTCSAATRRAGRSWSR